MRNGGAGCISATANVNPAAIDKLYTTWQNTDADAQQEALNNTRNTFSKFAMIPALKAAIAHYSGDPTWITLRPPLVELDSTQKAKLIDDLSAINFTMPGLKSA
jgi:4-hydroxy-tetrahydrodipicolinate synthase